jgi:septum formation protein
MQVMSKILLASESFLRRFIMDQSKLPYETIAADIDESIYDHLGVDERVVMLAKDKCDKIARDNTEATVIAADTLTTDESGLVYTKLTGTENPFQAALALSGKTIHVFTGCAIYSKESGLQSTLATAKITYQQFSEATLKRLASDDNPNIRSGALGVFYDAPGFTLIEKLEGSYTGAFGLPMEFVYAHIKEESWGE